MKTVFYVSMVSMILFAGCSSVHFVEHDESSNIETSKKIEGKQASITLRSGQTIEGNEIRVTLDSTHWFEPKSRSKQIVPTSAVKEIATKNSGKGALQGLGFRILVGGALGLLRGVGAEGEWIYDVIDGRVFYPALGV